MEELRPILVDNEYKAYFHCWEHCREFADSILGPGEILSRTLAIVEFMDGHIEKILPERITFINHCMTVNISLDDQNVKQLEDEYKRVAGILQGRIIY